MVTRTDWFSIDPAAGGLKPDVSTRAFRIFLTVLSLPMGYLAFRALQADAWLGYPLFSLLFLPLGVWFPLLLLNVAECPVVVIEGERGALELGGRAEVFWRYRSSTRWIRKLELQLTGQEQIKVLGTGGDGDPTVFTQQRSLPELVLETITDRSRIAEGHASLRLPAGLMHSFSSPHASVEWKLTLAGTQLPWNGNQDSFPLELRAPPSSRAAPFAGAGRFACQGDPALEIRVQGDRLGFSPGETVRGQVRWNLDGDDARRGLRLRLGWQTRGKGIQDEAVVASADFGPGPGRGEADFAFVLPPEPYGVRGEHLIIAWSLKLEVEGSERCCQGDLEVGPGGRDVVLQPDGRLNLLPGCTIFLLGLAAVVALFQVPIDEKRWHEGDSGLIDAAILTQHRFGLEAGLGVQTYQRELGTAGLARRAAPPRLDGPAARELDRSLERLELAAGTEGDGVLQWLRALLPSKRIDLAPLRAAARRYVEAGKALGGRTAAVERLVLARDPVVDRWVSGTAIDQPMLLAQALFAHASEALSKALRLAGLEAHNAGRVSLEGPEGSRDEGREALEAALVAGNAITMSLAAGRRPDEVDHQRTSGQLSALRGIVGRLRRVSAAAPSSGPWPARFPAFAAQAERFLRVADAAVERCETWSRRDEASPGWRDPRLDVLPEFRRLVDAAAPLLGD
jgi:hypothetical protein